METNKKILAIIAIAICAGMVTYGAYAIFVLNLYQPHDATIGITFTLDGAVWTNGSHVNWGTITDEWTGQKTFNVINSDPVRAYTVVITVDDLPDQWILTYDKNNTSVAHGTTLDGVLILTTPFAAPTGEYHWNCLVHVTEVT